MEPLALQLRPKTFDDVIGQPHLTGPDAVFRKSIESDNFGNFVLYGPSGSGKTSVVNVLEQRFSIRKFNATTFTAKEVRKVLEGENNVIVMIDECLPYNTIITCKIDGNIQHLPIGLLVEQQINCKVASYNHSTNVVEWRPITGWMVRAPRPMVEIMIDDNGVKKILRCSSEHLIYTTNRGYIMAKNILSSDEIVDLSKDKLQEINDVKTMQEMSERI